MGPGVPVFEDEKQDAWRVEDPPCQPPDRAEHPPAQGASQRYQGERGIGPRDQQVDGLVVQRPEYPFSGAVQSVIEGGEEIEQEQGETLDAVAQDLARIAIHRSIRDEDHASGECEGRADQVADAVESFAFVHAGIVSARGSPFSPMAVLARAPGIPAVVSLVALPGSSLAGSEMVVDGEEGRVYIQPSPELIAIFQRRIREAGLRAERLAATREPLGESLDGTRIPLHANIGLPADVAPAAASGAEGIGLYRTEYSFLLSDILPGEDDQLASYREVLAAFAPRPVTLRTLDVGGDRMLSYFFAVEDSPFLGCRGIRFSLDQPEIFLIQLRAMLRAMLRANAGLGNLQVLFPMIGTVGEVDEALGSWKGPAESWRKRGRTRRGRGSGR